MSSPEKSLTPKVHPAEREMLPDDPLSLHAMEVPGDPDLMLRLLVEEYARMGYDLPSIMQLARDPFYPAFHGLLLLFGEDELSRRVGEILGRVGVIRITTLHSQPPPEQLVSIRLPKSADRSDDHA